MDAREFNIYDAIRMLVSDCRERDTGLYRGHSKEHLSRVAKWLGWRITPTREGGAWHVYLSELSGQPDSNDRLDRAVLALAREALSFWRTENPE